MTQINSRHRVLGFDGLRAIAVFLVFLEHFVLNNHNLGGLGVKIFFVLSGFLIVGILDNQRKKIESNNSSIWLEFKTFWVKRIKRIFPIYYLVLFLLVLINLKNGKSINDQGLVFYLFMLGNYYIQNISHAWGSFTHLWSISVENHFYLFASPLILLVPRRFHIQVLSLIFILSLMIFINDLLNWDNVNKPYLSSVANFIFMSAGGLMVLLNERFAYFIKSNLMILFVSIFGFILMNFYLDQNILQANVKTALNYSIYLAIAVSLINFVYQNQSGYLVKVLNLKPIRYFGEISYGFYVFHYFVPHLPIRLSFIHHIGPIWIVFQFTLAFTLAVISWEFFEKRFLNRANLAKGKRGISDSVKSPSSIA